MRGPDERAVAALIQGWAAAARKGELEAIMACYMPDLVAFDAIAALQFKGAEAYRRHWETCLAHVPGGQMILEVHDLQIVCGGDIAFAHYLSHCGFVDEQGVEQKGWLRGSVGCRRTAEGWRIAHEHYSMPFDPESSKILTGLQP